MPHTHDMSSFLQKFRNEAEPLVIHTGIILILELALLLVGLAALSLEKLFPNHSWYFNLIERIDILITLALLGLFGPYILIKLTIRLTISIVEEVASGVEIVGELVQKVSRRGKQQDD